MLKKLINQNQISKLVVEYRNQEEILENEFQVKIQELQAKFDQELQKLQDQRKNLQLQHLIKSEKKTQQPVESKYDIIQKPSKLSQRKRIIRRADELKLQSMTQDIIGKKIKLQVSKTF